MKKTILKMIAVAGIVTGSVLSTNAQITKGSLMFGGSLGANMTMESTTKTTGADDVKVPATQNGIFANGRLLYCRWIGYWFIIKCKFDTRLHCAK